VSALPDNAGLCANCKWARGVVSDRGSVFLLCELSFSDPNFRKYPRLPVRSCSGYQHKGIELDWTTGELAEGLRCYRSGQFFEAHEHWESAWLKSLEPEKTFLQGLIQMTAAFHHYQRDNREGTASLLRQALRKLELFVDHGGQLKVSPLCTEIREWLRTLESEETGPIEFPKVQITSSRD